MIYSRAHRTLASLGKSKAVFSLGRAQRCGSGSGIKRDFGHQASERGRAFGAWGSREKKTAHAGGDRRAP